MKCDKCGKDRDYFSEIHEIARKDTTPNCYSIFHPRKPKKQLICWKCLGWTSK